MGYLIIYLTFFFTNFFITFGIIIPKKNVLDIFNVINFLQSFGILRSNEI